MSYKYDIVLSYATEDDLALTGSDKGWVANFRKFLVTLLSQIGKEQPRILEISELDNLIDVSEMGAVYIAILSESFFKQDVLVDSLNTFGRKAEEQNNLELSGKPRIFKVLKQPVNVDNHLPQLEDLFPYEFYRIDPRTGLASEYDRFFGNQSERAFWMKLVDMAYDIFEYGNLLKHRFKLQEDEESKNKTVYLANTGIDMIIKRDIIKRELTRHGYKILPDHTLPKEVNALREKVKEDLAKCRLSIHLIGEDYGYKPVGSDKSVVEIQNRVAMVYSREMAARSVEEQKNDPFRRLIWLSPDLNNVSERQRLFIEDLKTDAARLEQSEVLRITLQEFKSIIRRELLTDESLTEQADIEEILSRQDEQEERLQIYLICDRPELPHVEPVREYLTKKGYQVVLPSFDGTLIDIRYIHQQNLIRCDAAFIWCGNTSEQWVNAKLQDLLKAPGFGRTNPLLATAIFANDGRYIPVEKAARNNAVIINSTHTFIESDLIPFLSKLEEKWPQMN